MKYGNIKVKAGDQTFDSKLEYERWCELKLAERAGVIKELVVHPSFELQPKFVKNGKTYGAITYKADFSYWDNEKNKLIVEDTKGYKTDVYKIKQKLFEYIYDNLEITEITR